MAHTGSTAVSSGNNRRGGSGTVISAVAAAGAVCRGRVAMISARTDSAISGAVRAPMSSPAGAWIRARSSPVTGSHPGAPQARLRLATGATYGMPARTAAVSASISSRPCEAMTTALASSGIAPAMSAPMSAARPSQPTAAATSTSARATGASPYTKTNGSGIMASRKISSVPPERHGLATVSRPSTLGRGSPGASSGVMRRSVDSPEASSRSPWRRTVDSAQVPPTKPSIVPSGSTRARSPALALVGRSARTTVARTNGVRSLRRRSTRLIRARLDTAVPLQNTHLDCYRPVAVSTRPALSAQHGMDPPQQEEDHRQQDGRPDADRGSHDHVEDQEDGADHRQRQEHQPDRRQRAARRDQLGLAPAAEEHPVVRDRGDQAHGGQRGGGQRGEVDRVLFRADPDEPLGERHGQQER